jgi:Asp-tRNA(Asn)/Glu-tRNA(Gln) amidotransferase A subunit family amidase
MARDVTEMTAAEAARAIRTGKLSPVDLVDASLVQIDALDARIQAFCHVDRVEKVARPCSWPMKLQQAHLEGSFTESPSP